MVVLITIAGIVVLLALVGGLSYNSLVRRKNRTAEAWSKIDVELKRRHDLIPNLILRGRRVVRVRRPEHPAAAVHLP